MDEEKSQIDFDIEEKKITILTATSLKDIKQKVIKILQLLDQSKYPQDWTHVIETLDVLKGYKEVLLQPSSPKYNEVAQKFSN